ncbi:MAG: MFS sugar transporter [Alyxoria varia]|nr:MAG: MFS sugar transporter [Alyxoria varia]
MERPTPTRLSTSTSHSSQDEKQRQQERERVAARSRTSGDEKPETKDQAVLEEVKQETAEHEGEDDTEYPSSWKLAIVTLALCLSVLCMALDNTIIATAIPRITDQFNSINDVGWYGSAYLLTTCAFQLFFGKLYTFYSIKWTYLTALGIFEVGSAICGAAPNSEALIVGRAIAGFGSAGIFSGAILIVAHTVPLRKRPIYTGLIGAMYGIASVAGPLMGGAFTDHITWRWCFYINLPIGAVTALFIIFFFSSPHREAQTTLTWKEKIGQMDLLGTGIFVPAVVCLLLALQWGGSEYDWSSWRIILLFVFFGLLIITFLGIQIWKGEAATVPPRIFKQRNVWAASQFAAFLGASFFSILYYIPIWFQAIKDVSATKSGIMNLPMVLGLVILSILSGGAVSALGHYMPFIYLSVLFMSIGGGLLTTFEVTTDHPKWIGYQFIYGAGVGFGMQQSLIAVQTVLPLKDVPIGTATIMFSQTLGGALFISVAQNVFTNQLLKNVLASAPGLNPARVISVGATQLRTLIPADRYDAVLVAYNATLTQTFYVTVATSALSVIGAAFMEWKSVKGKKVEHSAGGA